MCQEFCSWGVYPSIPLGRTPGQTPPSPGRSPQADTPTWVDTLLGRHTLGRHHPGQTPPGTMRYGQQARGTHPTGTHSCLGNFLQKLVNSFYSGKSQVKFNVGFSVDLNLNCVVYGDVTAQMTIKLYHLLQQLTWQGIMNTDGGRSLHKWTSVKVYLQSSLLVARLSPSV